MLGWCVTHNRRTVWLACPTGVGLGITFLRDVSHADTQLVGRGEGSGSVSKNTLLQT
jgi:hypothetical protein